MARHSSLSSLDHHHHHLPSTVRPRRPRLSSTGSTCSGSTANLSTTNAPFTRRDYIASPISLSAMQNHHPLTTYRRPFSTSSSVNDDTRLPQHRHSSYTRSPSVPDSDSSTTSILSTHASADSRKSTADYPPHSLKNVSFSGDAVDASESTSSATRRRYDSPEEIIAALFPESVKDTNNRRKSSVSGAISAPVPSTLRKQSVTSATTTTTKVARPVSAVAVSNPPWLGAGSSGVVARRSSSSFGVPSRSTAAKRGIYRPDSLQTLDRDFDGMKYDLCVDIWFLESPIIDLINYI